MSATYNKGFDGIGRAELEQSFAAAQYKYECLQKEIEQLRQFNEQLDRQVGDVQSQCTALLLEARNYRQCLNADRHLAQVLANVVWERHRQDEKWGAIGTTDKQDAFAIPFGTGGAERQLIANVYRSDCDLAFESGKGTWAHVLQEEVAEALAEKEPAKLRTELIEVAAVACKIVEIIDRKAAG